MKTARFADCGRRIFGHRLAVGLLAVIPAAFLIEPLHWNALPASIRVIALIGITGGLFLRAWAAAHAGNHTRSSTIEAGKLASSGPYSRVRNPIYLGNFILGVGMVALLGDPWLIPLHLITFAVLYATIIPAEEQFLAREFGSAYQAYVANVPRLFPRLLPWSAGASRRPEWHNAFGEVRIAAILVAIYAALQMAPRVLPS